MSTSQRFTVNGVDRETSEDVEIIIEAASEANARVKAELRGVIVTSVQTLDAGREDGGLAPNSSKTAASNPMAVQRPAEDGDRDLAELDRPASPEEERSTPGNDLMEGKVVEDGIGTTEPGVKQKPEARGIAGWLIIPAIGLVFAPIKSAVLLFLGFGMVQSLAPELTSDPRLWFSGMIDVAMIVAAIIVAVLFFKKRRVAVGAIIGLMVAAIIANLGQALLIAAMFGVVDTDTVRSVIASCVYAAVWIPYFLKSKRVKNTFVE